jgi:FG-GAP-like repeat
MKISACLLVALAFFGVLRAAIAQVPFALSDSLTNGTFVRSVTVADVNGDGRPDLICVRGNPSFLYVWTNSGSGIFVSNASYAVGGFPYQVIAADVNNDSRPDLITANNSGNSLTVLTNDGHGNFAVSATLGEGSGQSPQSVAAADLFGRGHLDLVSANSQNASFTIWTNSGAGGIFVSNLTLSVGTPQMTVPVWVTTADINGDGRPDIIGACNNSDTYYLHIWTNNGTGGFVNDPVPFLSLNGMLCVAAADLNGDGKPDLALAINSLTIGNGIMVLTNNGNGAFTRTGFYPTPAVPYAVVAADVNGDGAQDLIGVNQGNNTLTVWTNNGSGIFSSNATLAVGSGPESMTAGDINGDGRMDLISGNWNAGTLTVLTNAATFLPQLGLRRSGAGVVVSWPAVWANWTLQQNTNLNQGSWASFNGLIGSDGVSRHATNSLSGTNCFFRLSLPSGL